MDTHIKLLLLALVLVVLGGAGLLAWSLGALALAPVIVLAFVFALSHRASEPEILARRLRSLLLVFFVLVALGLLVKLR